MKIQPLWQDSEYFIADPSRRSEVHAWRFTLDPPSDRLSRYERSLNADELRRADRFRTEALRRRFVVGRGGLRAVLGRHLGCAAGDVEFSYGEHGKPALAQDRGIEFNLAHTQDIALCAVARGRAVGVDVEGLRAIDNAARIILRFFSPREQTDFLALSDSERYTAFFRGWTRKEAFLKATGTGLATELDSFDVTLRPDQPAALLRVGSDPSEVNRWTICDIDVGPGLAAALVVAAHPDGLSLRFWDGIPTHS